jgi:hypothetical protein
VDHYEGQLGPTLRVPMSTKSDLFENAFLDPTPTQRN